MKTLSGINPIDFCFCAKCGKRVESVAQCENVLTRSITVNVYCHGEVETFEIEHKMIVMASSVNPEPTLFFNQQYLPE